MARPISGRRLHTAAFDAIVSVRGTNSSELASTSGVSASHISDMRSGRRLVTPPIARSLADALNIVDAEALMWPVAAERGAA